MSDSPSCRWVFWVDHNRQTIERIGVNGRGREIIKSIANLGSCVEAMTLDFPTFTIFYIDRCSIKVMSVRMDGVRTSSSLSLSLQSLISKGVSVFQDFIYWTDSSTFSVRGVNRTTGDPVVKVSPTIRTLFGGVEVVHPKKQPICKKGYVINFQP